MALTANDVILEELTETHQGVLLLVDAFNRMASAQERTAAAMEKLAEVYAKDRAVNRIVERAVR